MEKLLTELFTLYSKARVDEKEGFGDFCYRVGNTELKNYIDTYNDGEEGPKNAEALLDKIKAIPTPEDEKAKDFIGGKADAELVYA